MRPKTNRLLMLMISAMLAGCASQTERSSSGLGTGQTEEPAPQAQPAPPPPAYTPEPDAVQYSDRPLEATPPPKPESQPLPDFPITTYELPEEEEIADLGTQPDDSGTVAYPQEDIGTAASTIGAPTTFAELEEEEEVADLGTQPDQSGTMSFAESDLGARQSGVGAPTVYPDQVAMSLSFEAEPLFSFDKAFVRGDQRRVLDEFVASLAGTEYESIEAVGFADRIGPEAYNQKLSMRRAEAVKAYLAAKGIPSGKIRTEGRGESESVTGDACAKMRGNALIGCLEPDRRVDVTVTAVKMSN